MLRNLTRLFCFSLPFIQTTDTEGEALTANAKRLWQSFGLVGRRGLRHHPKIRLTYSVVPSHDQAN